MDVNEFIDKLFTLYPNSWTGDNMFLKKKQYLAALDNGKIEFEKLFDRIAKYNNSSFMPEPAWLREQSIYCYKEEYKNTKSEWLSVRVYDPILKTIRNTDCFKKGTSEKGILNFYKKKFGGYGWKIIEVRAF